MTRELSLQPRLALLASLVPQGAVLADVGTDHGYIPVCLRQRGVIDRAIASDIGREPLEHARRTAEEYGVGGIDLRLCAGLDAIAPEECDTVLIAGMGGETIWGATAALYASWVGGSANMAAMQDALPVDAGAYACALTLDTVCYSVWIALLLFAVKYAGKWNKSVKADTSKLEAVAAAANAEVANEKTVQRRRRDAVGDQPLYLILHQGDQGGHHQSRTRQIDSR